MTPKLPMEAVTKRLNAAGMIVLDTEVVGQHSTMAEKKAWLSIPVFVRPGGEFTHAQRMDILAKAYALTTPDAPTVTSWLVAVAQRPKEERRPARHGRRPCRPALVDQQSSARPDRALRR